MAYKRRAPIVSAESAERESKDGEERELPKGG
jgi:hypothetical protein